MSSYNETYHEIKHCAGRPSFFLQGSDEPEWNEKNGRGANPDVIDLTIGYKAAVKTRAFQS